VKDTALINAIIGTIASIKALKYHGWSANKKTTRRPIIIDDVVLDLQETLDELNQHNLLIKHLLRDQLYGMGGVFVGLLVFMLSNYA